MRARTVKILWCITVFSFLLPGFLSGDQILLAPCDDVYVITFGGGEGCNPFLKFDISLLPSGRVIDSVFVTAYIWQDNPSWDGDVNFWNVNSQVWTEADSSALIWSIPTSDSLLQPTGFGTILGWSSSIDIKDIFLTDYNVGNTYCTIKMKDPDDGTFNPMPGSYPVNSNDTLAIGDRLFPTHIYFYPHEYPNGPPWLVIHYHTAGCEEERRDRGSLHPFILRVYPNPFTESAEVLYCGEKLEIFDCTGKLVRTTVSSSFGHDLPVGIYFVHAEGYRPTKVVKVQ
jgi:hypothetical protein